MYYMKNKQVEVICTLNHKLYVKRREKTKGDKEYELIEAENVMGKMVRFQKSMNNTYSDIEYITFGEKKYKMEFGFCLKNSTFAVLKKIVEKKQNAYHTAISS